MWLSCYSDFYQSITLWMSSIESHLSNKPKTVYTNYFIFSLMWYNSTTLLHCSYVTFLKFLETGLIYLDMLNVYKAYSEFISTAIQRSGPQIAQHSNIRAMRQVKVEILTLISTFVNSGVSKKKKKKGNVWKNSKNFEENVVVRIAWFIIYNN